MRTIKYALLVVGLSCLVGARAVDATFTHQFGTGDGFANDVVGSTEGPFTDPANGFSAILTTKAIVGGTQLNTSGTPGTNGRLGVHPGNISNAFDPGESWSMDWSQNSQFVGISLHLYTNVTENFAFSVQSAEWIGLSITPGTADVLFNSGSGTFTFSSLRAPGASTKTAFNASDLYGAGAIPVVANTRNITFAYSGPTGEFAGIGSLSFNLLIPEPATVSLLAVGALLLWRRKLSHP